MDILSDKFAIEQIAKERFGISFEIKNIIAEEFPISMTGSATIFMTDKKQVYAYIFAESKLVLGDVQKIISRIGLKAEKYIPPKEQPDYFNEVGRAKFRTTYPARSIVSDSDLMFYKTLAPYNPALVLVKEIKNGEIKQFDTDSNSNWRVFKKFAYRRISTK